MHKLAKELVYVVYESRSSSVEYTNVIDYVNDICPVHYLCVCVCVLLVAMDGSGERGRSNKVNAAHRQPL